MTKINKLGKSTFVIAILSFILVAVLAFGGTYAYFSARSTEATATITLGHLKIDGNASFDQDALTALGVAVPNELIITASNGTFGVDVDSNIEYFIRANITYTATAVGTHASETTCDDATGLEVLLITPDGDWAAGADVDATSKEGWYYLTKAQPAGTLADGKYVTPHTFDITARVNPEVGRYQSQHWMDATIKITVVFEVIQANYIVGDAAVDMEKTYTVQELATAFGTAKLDKPAQPDGE